VCRGGPMKILRADRGRLPNALLLVPLLLLLAACVPASPLSPVSSSEPSTRATAPKRITASIRGTPKSFMEIRTMRTGGAPPGLDAVEELVLVGLTGADVKG